MKKANWQELEIQNAQLWLERLSGVDDLIRFWDLHGPNLTYPYPEIERI